MTNPEGSSHPDRRFDGANLQDSGEGQNEVRPTQSLALHEMIGSQRHQVHVPSDTAHSDFQDFKPVNIRLQLRTIVALWDVEPLLVGQGK